MIRNMINQARRADQRRTGVPGEHWLAATAGMWLLRRPARNPMLRLASKAAGAALLLRAAGGRDGLRRLFGR